MNKKNNKLNFQFIGIWGSGKSSIINQINTTLEIKGLSVFKETEYFTKNKYFYLRLIFKLFLFKPIYFFKILFYLIRFYIILKPKHKVEYDIYKILAKSILIRNELDKPQLHNISLSEGIYHLLPVFKNMKNLKEIDFLFLDSIVKKQKTYFIFIEINPSDAYRRVVEDNEINNRFSKDELLNLKKRYEIMIKNQKLIKNNLSENNIIILNGNKSIAENSFFLSKIIFNMIN